MSAYRRRTLQKLLRKIRCQNSDHTCKKRLLRLKKPLHMCMDTFGLGGQWPTPVLAWKNSVKPQCVSVEIMNTSHIWRDSLNSKNGYFNFVFPTLQNQKSWIGTKLRCKLQQKPVIGRSKAASFKCFQTERLQKLDYSRWASQYTRDTQSTNLLRKPLKPR